MVNHCFRQHAELMGLSLLIAAAALVFKAEAEFHCRECKDTNLRHVCIDVYCVIILYIILYYILYYIIYYIIIIQCPY